MTDFVNVPVPPDRVMDVYRLLGEQNGEPSSTPEAYDEVTVQRLYDESGPEAQRILKHLMCHADELVPGPDLAEAAGLDGGLQLGGTLGALSKRCKTRYGKGLPFNIRTIGDHNFYVMPKRIADMVNRAR